MLKLEHHKLNAFCELPFRHVKINVNGDVTMCCYQGKPLGNVLVTPMKDIWGQAITKEIQRATQNGILHKNCISWGACPHINTDLQPRKEIKYHTYLPISVEIDLPSTHCNIGGLEPDDKNQACIMCPRNSENFRNHPYFKINNIEKIVDAIKPLVPTMDCFSILGVAEPFWRGLIFEIFDSLNFKDHKDHIFFWTFTNGSIFNEDIAERFLDYTNRTMLYVSVDAGSPETYIKIRRRDFFDTIKKNIAHYTKICGPNHLVKIYNNINTLNVHELDLMVDFAKDVGANELIFNPTHDAGGSAEVGGLLLTKDNLPLFQQNHRKAQARANELGVQLVMYRSFEQVAGVPDNLVNIELG